MKQTDNKEKTLQTTETVGVTETATKFCERKLASL